MTQKLTRRGYSVLYRAPQACPGCGHGNWLIGRSTAECAYCGTALPLAPAPVVQEARPRRTGSARWW